MKDDMVKELVKRHGEEVIVMSRKDWEKFINKIKSDHPDLHEVCKKEFNFTVTNIEFELGEVPVSTKN